MTIRPLLRDEVRGIDRTAHDDCGIPTLILMENAGRGAADWLRRQLQVNNARILIACGPGNNGGDGGVVARHLDAWGFDVHVLWFAQPDRLRGDAAIQWSILSRSEIRQTVWSGPEEPGPSWLDSMFCDVGWVVDGLLGTGLTRPVEGSLRAAIEGINRSGKRVLSLDLPSGLDADTGEPQGIAVRATATATFVGRKAGFDRPGASDYTGEVVVVDIGVPRRALRPFMQP